MVFTKVLLSGEIGQTLNFGVKYCNWSIVHLKINRLRKHETSHVFKNILPHNSVFKTSLPLKTDR